MRIQSSKKTKQTFVEKRKAYAETLESIKNEEAEAIGSHKGSPEELD